MKKFIKILPLVIAISACFCLAFAACADEPDGQNGSLTSGDTNGETPDLGDVLIVYFSATNNTEKIAGYIAEITDGTLFELEPQTPYTEADLKYGDANSRVSKERSDPSLRNVPLVKATPDGWDNYETVFVGYPIWWGGASLALNGFITANDFTGKTVIPFCTSASSPIGNSDTLLKEMATGGDWKAGRRFSSSSSKNDVQSWISGFNV